MAHKFTGSPAAAFWGGLCFGFSPYVFAQLALHPHLSFVALVPLGCLLYLKWQDQEVSNTKFVAAGSVLLAAQAGISLEVLSFGAIAAIPALAIDYKRLHPRQIIILAALGLVALVLMSPILYYFLRVGPNSIPPPPSPTTAWTYSTASSPLPISHFMPAASMKRR